LHVYGTGGVSLATTGTVNYTNTSILGFGYGGGSTGTRDSFRIISQAVNRDNGAGPYYDYGAQADLVFVRKTNNLYSSGANDMTYTEAMRIHGASGFMGIGTYLPATPLHVFSSSTGHPSIIRINTTISSFGSSANGGRLEWYGTYTANGAAYFQSAIQGIDDVSGDSGYGGLAFITVNNTTQRESMRISSGGNVGIGTTNPNATLHVNGSIKCGTIASTSFTFTASAGATTIIANSSSNGYAGNTVILITVNGLNLSVSTFGGTTVTASAYVSWDYGAPSYANVYGMVATRGDISITASGYGLNFNVPTINSNFYISYSVTILRMS
jgi:hypothetical protein